MCEGRRERRAAINNEMVLCSLKITRKHTQSSTLLHNVCVHERVRIVEVKWREKHTPSMHFESAPALARQL